MDTAIVQKRVDDIAKAMTERGLLCPRAQTMVISNEQPRVFLSWNTDGGEGKYNLFVRDEIGDALSAALDFVRAMPDREQRNLNEFLEKLGSVIDLGNKHQIDVEFLNPLVKTMKKLSENALTHRKSEAA